MPTETDKPRNRKTPDALRHTLNTIANLPPNTQRNARHELDNVIQKQRRGIRLNQDDVARLRNVTRSH